MHTRILYILFLPFLALLSNTVEAKDQPIHFVKAQQTEFVSGGGIETITLEINAPSFNAPFIWSVTIENTSGILFSVERNDAWLDSFFENNEYVTNCNGYKECKEKWYFNELVKQIAEEVQVYPGRLETLEKWETEALEAHATEYLRRRSEDQNKLQKIVSEMKILLANGYSGFTVPISPVENDSSFMYVES